MIRYGTYDLHLSAHQTPLRLKEPAKWTSSAIVTQWSDEDSVAMGMAWTTNFETEAMAIDFALQGAKKWADANPSQAVD